MIDLINIFFLPLVLILMLAYAAMMLIFSKAWNSKDENVVKAAAPVFGAVEFPLVTVVIPCKNEMPHLLQLLDDLVHQDYPADALELFVLDDHSTDDTALAVENFKSDHHGFNVRRLTALETGKKAALTFGVDNAAGDIILAVDGDCRVGPLWVRAMVSRFSHPDIMMVTGPVNFERRQVFLNIFQQIEFAGLVASGAGAALAHAPLMCNGANLAFSRGAFLQVNGYQGNQNLESGDDMFLMMKIKHRFGAQAITFAKSQEAIVVTTAPETLWKFLKQRLRWVYKSRGYRDLWVVFVAALVYLVNFFLVAAAIFAFFIPGFWVTVGLLFILKCLADYPLLSSFLAFTGRKKLLWWFLPSQVVNVIYVALIGFVGQLVKVGWKR